MKSERCGNVVIQSTELRQGESAQHRRKDLLRKFEQILNAIDDSPCEWDVPPSKTVARKTICVPLQPIGASNPCDPCAPCYKSGEGGRDKTPRDRRQVRRGFSSEACRLPSDDEQRRKFINYRKPEKALIEDKIRPQHDRYYPLKSGYKSRELIGGQLFTGCECVKRNGLQDQCPRTDCGIPECIFLPDPKCLPSGGPGPQQPRSVGLRGPSYVTRGGVNCRVIDQKVRECPECNTTVLMSTVQKTTTCPPDPPTDPRMACNKWQLVDPPCVRDWCVPCNAHGRPC